MIPAEARRAWLEETVLRVQGTNPFIAAHVAALLDAPLRELEEALDKMLSPETDWENGEVGVGNTFRQLARAALAGLPWREEEKR